MDQLLSFSARRERSEPPLAVAPGSGNLESVLLADQNLRVEKHKTNFEALKNQHIILTDAHAKLAVDHTVLNEEMLRMEKRSEEIIAALQKERDQKIEECEQLRAQVLTPERLAEVQAELVAEMEGPYRKYVGELEAELDSFKSDYNKLKYNYSFLKSELESRAQQHRTEQEEETARHRAEVESLLGEKRELLARSHRDIPAEVQRMRQLQRENSEFQQKVNMLTLELEQEREQLLALEAELKRCQATLQRGAEQGRLEKRELEEERGSLEDRLALTRREVEEARQSTAQVRKECTEQESRVTQLNRQIDSMSHEHKMQVSNLQISLAQQSQQSGQDQERLEEKLAAGLREQDLLKKTLQDQQNKLLAKSQECEEVVLQVRQEEWSKMAAVEQDLSEAQEKADQAEERRATENSDHKKEVESLGRSCSGWEEKARGLEAVLAGLRRDCQDKDQRLDQLRAAQQESSSLAAQLSRLQEEGRVRSEELQRAQQAVESLSEERAGARQELQAAGQDRAALQREVEGGRRELDRLQEKHRHLQDHGKKKMKDYRRRLQTLQQELEQSRAEVEKGRLEKDHAEKTAKLETRRLLGKFKNLQHHHQRLLLMLNQVPSSTLPGLDFTKSVPSLHVDVLHSLTSEDHLPPGRHSTPAPPPPDLDPTHSLSSLTSGN